MTELHKTLALRFGEHRVSEISVSADEIPLLALDLESRSPVTVILTNGLSEYKMPVPEKLAGYEFNEIYFCLPSYWEWQDLDTPEMNWVFHWIQRLAKHAIEKQTWFGHGHTIPCGSNLQSLSKTMLQNHFILTNPTLLEHELEPIQLETKNIHFLAIVPMFGDEMDYKQGKGTLKLLRKFLSHGVSEILDDYRDSVLKSKWRISTFRK